MKTERETGVKRGTGRTPTAGEEARSKGDERPGSYSLRFEQVPGSVVKIGAAK